MIRQKKIQVINANIKKIPHSCLFILIDKITVMTRVKLEQKSIRKWAVICLFTPHTSTLFRPFVKYINFVLEETSNFFIQSF